jgi:putative tryptophan/tyrosine transport system substrate-binding protein
VRRRGFIAFVGGAAMWPLTARAQQQAMPVVGFLGAGSPDTDGPRVRALRQGLSETGYVEGRNVAIEYRWAEGQYDRFPVLAADLVRRQVNVIAAFGGTASVLAAKAATSSIPIAFTTGVDPVEIGLVDSLNRPGGNLTGINTSSTESAPKWLELLHEAVPSVSRFGLLVNPTSRALAEAQTSDLRKAAAKLALEVHVLNASTDGDFDGVFTKLAELRAGGLIVTSDSLFSIRADRLAALAMRDRVPAIFAFREFAAAGGLMSYGASLADASRLAGIYAGRILKGEKPADLPVQRVTKLELVINLKTAKAIGLEIPPSLLARADEVIE